MKSSRILHLLHALPLLLAAATSPAFADSPTAIPPAPAGTTISLHAAIPPATDAAKAPTFYAVTLDQTIRLAGDYTPRVRSSVDLSVRVLQGEVSRVTLAFNGKETVGDFTGENVATWESRRSEDGTRLVDIYTKTPVRPGTPFRANFTFASHTTIEHIANGSPGRHAVPVFSMPAAIQAAPNAANPNPAQQVSIDGTVTVRVPQKLAARIQAHDGLFPVSVVAATGNTGNFPPSTASDEIVEYRFTYDPANRKPALLRFTVASEPVTLGNFSLQGTLDPGGETLHFTLTAKANVLAPNAQVPILSGDAALVPTTVKPVHELTPATPAKDHPSPDYHVVLDARTGGYALQFNKTGVLPVTLSFVAKLTRKGDATSVNFTIPGVPIAPFALQGFRAGTQFTPAADIPPLRALAHQAGADAPLAAHYTGYLSPQGRMELSWRNAKADTDARLFFSTEEVSDITVRPGLLRQTARFRYQILQGKMDTLVFTLYGDGEILRVNGADVLSWKVEEGAQRASETKSTAGARALVVRLAQPVSGEYTLAVEAQTPLGNFPLKTTPLAIAPQDGVRHSGFVQVTNEGAVRLESTPRTGLTQVAPALFPESRSFPENTQRFVYRIASAETAMDIQADNILPEVNVSALALYRITESDLFIDLEAELDVREAPLQEFTLGIPVGYTVSQTEQLDAWSYTLGAQKSGTRFLHLNFTRPLTGRNLIKFRLEQSRTTAVPRTAIAPTRAALTALSAVAAAHPLARITFPGAKSVRGHIGIVAAPGLRVTPASTDGVTEIATAFFPRRTDGLQQAYRLRDPAWGVIVRVERLDLAVQSDALHLFAVREGLVSASTTVNYAIVGAPLGEFHFRVPTEVRNLEFAGKDIRAWKRDGDTLTVSLHKPVSGSFTLLGTYDLPLDPRGGIVSLIGLCPLGVQSEQGFVLVTSDLQFNVKNETVSPALTAVEPGEIPAEYRMMFDAPLLAAYQYAARPYDLKLGLQLRPQSNTLNQVVDFASLSTRLSADGQIITEARYLVKSHGHSHLRLAPPPGLKLWTARVDSAAVLPVTDAATTLIPLPARPDANAILTVDLRFAGTAAVGAKIRLDAPALAAPIINTRWEVEPDEGTKLQFVGGNLSKASGDNNTAKAEYNIPAASNYVIQPGDTFHKIAKKTGVSIKALVAANPSQDPQAIRVGQQISIPTQPGDEAISENPESAPPSSGATAWTLIFVGIVPAFIASLFFAFAGFLRRRGHRKSASTSGALGVLSSIGVFFFCGLILVEGSRWGSGKPPAPSPAGNTLVFTAPIHAGSAKLQLGGNATEAKQELGAPGAAAAHYLELTRETAPSHVWTILSHLGLLLVGIALAFFAFIKKSPVLREVTWAYFAILIVAAGGTHITWLGPLLAAFFFFEILLPGLRCFRAAPAASATTTALLAFVLLGSAGSATRASADELDPKLKAFVAEVTVFPNGTPKITDRIWNRITISEKDITGSAILSPNGEAGDRFDLLTAPAVLVGVGEFREGTENEKAASLPLPAGTRIVQIKRDGKLVTQLVLEKPAGFSLRIDYTIPGGAQTAHLRIPTAAALVDYADVSVAPGTSIQSDAAASITESARDSHRIIFLPRAERTIRWTPKARDRRTEPLIVYAESTDLFVPSLGVLDGRHALKIRPAQGLLTEVNLLVPAGLSVANVSGPAAGQWRFDPEKRRLAVRIEPAQSNETTLLIETQMGMGALPQQLTLAPLAIEGATGQVGMVALGTGDDVQIATAEAKKMLVVTNEDFAQSAQDSYPGAKLRRSFRYSDTGASLAVGVEAVEPEVRVESQQRLSLGEDRIVLNADWKVDITRAAVFRLSFELPEGLEVESITGPALSHWTEVAGSPRRILLHLRGRTLGRQNFALTFSGPGITGKKAWAAPRLVLHEAVRQTGELTVVPEEGVRLHVATRTGATQYDPGSQSRLPKSSLAFRLPQRDWNLGFEIENLAPWIQATYLHDITVRDGQIRALVNFEYTIENAATKALRIQLPPDATSVRFTGPLVADAVEVKADAEDRTNGTDAPAVAAPGNRNSTWEVRLTRRALGKTTVQATYLRPVTGNAAAGSAGLSISGVRAADAGLQHGWLALRTAGRLEIKLGAVPPALAASDWQAVPAALRRGLAEPSAVLRMVESAYTLPVGVVTHDPAKLLALRIEKAELFTMLSNERKMLTRVHLTARPAEKSLLRVTLPAGAVYWHGFVNNEPVRVAQDGAALLVPVAPNAIAEQPATVEFFYAAPTDGGELEHKLEGPRFDVPLENITWRVQLPDGRVLAQQKSDLRFVPEASVGGGRGGKLASVEDYLESNRDVLSQKYAQAEKLIALGNRLKNENQVQAVQALQQAKTLSKGNDALNEDARVQLDTLRQSQIEVGMNRWKQNFTNTNTVNIGSNGGLLLSVPPSGSAVQAQVFSPGDLQIQGGPNFTQAEVSLQRSQNSAEENEVTRKIAERFLTQQTSVAGTPDLIRTLIPTQGRSVVFERTLQVGTATDLSLQLSLSEEKPAPAPSRFWPVFFFGLLMLVLGLVFPRILRK